VANGDAARFCAIELPDPEYQDLLLLQRNNAELPLYNLTNDSFEEAVSMTDEPGTVESNKATIHGGIKLLLGILLLLMSSAAVLWFVREPLINKYCSKTNSEADLKVKQKNEDEAISKYRNVIWLCRWLDNKQDRNKLHAMRELYVLLKLKNRWNEANSLSDEFHKSIGDVKCEPFVRLVYTVSSGSVQNPAVAEQTIRMLLEEIARTAGKESMDYATGLSILSNYCRLNGNYPLAQQSAEMSFNLSEKLLGTEDPLVASRLYELAFASYMSKRNLEAEKDLARVIELSRKTAPFQLAEAYNLLGLVYKGERQLDRAVENFKLAGAAWKSYNGKGANYSFLSNLAQAQEDQGKIEESIANYKQVVELVEKAQTQEILKWRRDVLESLMGLARIYLSTGQYPESEKYARMAMEMTQKGIAKGPPLSEFYAHLCKIRMKQGKTKEAQQYLDLARSAAAGK
jgi:hypothetical protein